MQKLSNSKLIEMLSTLLVLLLIAKIISLAIWWLLPSDGVELNVKESFYTKYQRVQFSNMLTQAKVSQKPIAKQEKVIAYNINNLILKGLYGNRYYGYAIVAKKSKPKETTIIEVEEKYAGYILKEIGLNEVIFTKANKEYVLKLDSKSLKDVVNKVKKPVQSGGSSENEKQVTREDIKAYSANPSKIWKDISIVPLKKGGKIEGFQVKRIKRGSKMAELGLQKGDVIIEANNIKLNSFKDALNLYKKIDTIDTIALTIKRDHEEKEIIYEIR